MKQGKVKGPILRQPKGLSKCGLKENGQYNNGFNFSSLNF